MCELLAMSTLQAAHLTFSLEALASHSGISCSNRDGWGAAFYQGHDVALFREPVAASESPLVRLLTQEGPATTLAISHIRRATLGVVSLANTQPFVRELAGRMHTFAHNGHLPGMNSALRRSTQRNAKFCSLLGYVSCRFEVNHRIGGAINFHHAKLWVIPPVVRTGCTITTDWGSIGRQRGTGKDCGAEKC